MTTSNDSSSEQEREPYPELVDTLYNLQAFREMSGAEEEMAIIPGTEGEVWGSDYSVLFDRHTGDRIVISSLPTDQAEFVGATVWMSNTEGVDVELEGREITAKDVIFWIDNNAESRFFNPEDGSRIIFDSEALAKRITYPRIYPEAQSDYDPRTLPDEHDFEQLERIITPKHDAYTLVSRIYDAKSEELKDSIEPGKPLVISNLGEIDYGEEGKSTKFEIKITENPPKDCSPQTEFDREFLIAINTLEILSFGVHPWGESETHLTTCKFQVSLFREGFVVTAFRGEKPIYCIPGDQLSKFMDRILHNTEENSQNNISTHA